MKSTLALVSLQVTSAKYVITVKLGYYVPSREMKKGTF